MNAYYNENDPYAAQWLRNLMEAGLIMEGTVDERSIKDIEPSDVTGTRAHFFAGIAGWDYALRLAGWPEDRPVWTGSCPCQPFSSAARGRNTQEQDERHLWPVWREIITKKRPPIIFGEQVAHARCWLDSVCNDMEAMDYAVWAAVLPAFSVGKDHPRYRIYFAAYPNSYGKPTMSFDAKVVGSAWNKKHNRRNARTYGVSPRMGQRRAYGNAIVPQLAAEFIAAFMEAERIKSSK